MDDLVGFVNDNKGILNIIKMIYPKSKRIHSIEMYFEVVSIYRVLKAKSKIETKSHETFGVSFGMKCILELYMPD